MSNEDKILGEMIGGEDVIYVSDDKDIVIHASFAVNTNEKYFIVFSGDLTDYYSRKETPNLHVSRISLERPEYVGDHNYILTEEERDRLISILDQPGIDDPDESVYMNAIICMNDLHDGKNDYEGPDVFTKKPESEYKKPDYSKLPVGGFQL